MYMYVYVCIHIYAHTFGACTQIDVDLLSEWESSRSNFTSVFGWLYKTGKFNAINFPVYNDGEVPDHLKCAEELSGINLSNSCCVCIYIYE